MTQLPTDLMNDSTGLMTGIAQWAYNVTFGWFWTIILGIFCVVIYISASRYSDDRAFGYASIVGLLGSIFLVILNLMSWYVASIFIILGILGIAWMTLNRTSY